MPQVSTGLDTGSVIQYRDTDPEVSKDISMEFSKLPGFHRQLMNQGRFMGNKNGYTYAWQLETAHGRTLKSWDRGTEIATQQVDNRVVLQMGWSLYYDAFRFSEFDRRANSGKQQFVDWKALQREKMKEGFLQGLRAKFYDGDGTVYSGDSTSGLREIQGIRTFLKSTGTAGLSYPAGSSGASLTSTTGHLPIIVNGDAGPNGSFFDDFPERTVNALTQATRTYGGSQRRPENGFATRDGIYDMKKAVLDTSRLVVNLDQTTGTQKYKHGFSGGVAIEGVDIEIDEHISNGELFLLHIPSFELRSMYGDIVMYDRGRKDLATVGDDDIDLVKSVLQLACRCLGCQSLVYWST